MRRRQSTGGSINAIFLTCNFLSPTICHPSGSENLGMYTLYNPYNELKTKNKGYVKWLAASIASRYAIFSFL